MQKNDFGGNWHSLLEKIIYKLKAHSVYEPLTYNGRGRECKNFYHSYYQYSKMFSLLMCVVGV